MRGWILTSILLSAGCASAGSAPPVSSPDSVSSLDSVRAEVRVDHESLDRAADTLKSGDLTAATIVADSLAEEWIGSAGLDPGGAEDLARLLARVGAEDRAVAFLMRVPFELDGAARGLLRELLSRLSISEMETLLEITNSRPEARSILQEELAVALAEADHPDRARDMARSVLEGTPDGEGRDRAEEVLEGRVQPLHGPVRVGAVVSRTGRFAAVGDQILEGVQLALKERIADSSLAAVELVVMDDSSRVEAGIALAEDLEKEGVMAILGPLRTEALASAAIRRKEDDLVLLSPTASGGQGALLNAYTLWDRRRGADEATALLTWMVDQMDLATFGVLYPDGSVPALDALRARAGELGVDILAARPYAADSTTFGEPIGALATAEPEAVIVLSDRGRTVLQLAPQLVYYGLRRWVIGGDENWGDPGVVRRLDASYADHRLVATYVDRLSPDTEWQQFKAAYEAEYRKALNDNMFTALGYDAMGIILQGIPEVDPARRGAIGRAIRRGTYRGATGDIDADVLTGGLKREILVRVIQDGALEVPEPDEMMQWAAAQLELEEFLRAREEEKEKEQQGETGEGGPR